MGWLLVVSWTITLCVCVFAIWLFLRYGRLVAESSTSRAQFDVAVSLGSRCEVAFQLAQHGYRDASFPFDWIVTPIGALYQLIENDFKGLLDPGDLVLVPPDPTAPDSQPFIMNSLGLQF